MPLILLGVAVGAYALYHLMCIVYRQGIEDGRQQASRPSSSSWERR